MQQAEWDKWLNYHATIFALRDREGLAMLESWRKVFEGARYTGLELEEATDWLAGHEPPRYRSDHLPALHRRILQTRAVHYRRPEVEPDTKGTCTVCGGTGLVNVPHPRGIAQGYWVPIKLARGSETTLYTATVLCTCALGRWMAQRGNPDKPQMRLEEYEKLNPDWLEQREARWAQLQAEAALLGPLGTHLQAVLDRLRKPATNGVVA